MTVRPRSQRAASAAELPPADEAGRLAPRLRWPSCRAWTAWRYALVTCPWTRYYLSPERDVVLALFGTRTGWHIGDHIAAAPRTGRGRALRILLLPELLPVADARRVTIHATAASPELAALYMAELPGPVDVGGGMFRGRRLRRPPAT